MFGGKYEIFMFEYKFCDIQIKNFVAQYKLKTLSEEEKGL